MNDFIKNIVLLFLSRSVCSDEDMQSLASLMSMKQADIGNLDDFEEENEEDEENRVNQEEKAAKITGETCLISSEDSLQVNLMFLYIRPQQCSVIFLVSFFMVILIFCYFLFCFLIGSILLHFFYYSFVSFL